MLPGVVTVLGAAVLTEPDGGPRPLRLLLQSIDATAEAEQTLRSYTPAVVEGPGVAAHFVGDSSRLRGTRHYAGRRPRAFPVPGNAHHYAQWYTAVYL